MGRFGVGTRLERLTSFSINVAVGFSYSTSTVFDFRLQAKMASVPLP